MWKRSVEDEPEMGRLCNNPRLFVCPPSALNLCCSNVTCYSASVLSYRMLIDSTRATCQSSLPWHHSTHRPVLATSAEAQATRGTHRILTGVNPLKRKSCSHAGREHQTTALSLLYSDLQTATATQGRDTPTMGHSLRPQSNLFLAFPFSNFTLCYLIKSNNYNTLR